MRPVNAYPRKPPTAHLTLAQVSAPKFQPLSCSQLPTVVNTGIPYLSANLQRLFAAARKSGVRKPTADPTHCALHQDVGTAVMSESAEGAEAISLGNGRRAGKIRYCFVACRFESQSGMNSWASRPSMSLDCRLQVSTAPFGSDKAQRISHGGGHGVSPLSQLVSQSSAAPGYTAGASKPTAANGRVVYKNQPPPKSPRRPPPPKPKLPPPPPPPSQPPVDIKSLDGRWMRKPAENGWHKVDIQGGRWRNAEQVEWGIRGATGQKGVRVP